MKKNSATKSPRRKQESRPRTDHDQDGSGRQDEPVLRAERKRGSDLERSVATTKKGMLQAFGASNDAGSPLRWAPIRLGEPVAVGRGTRGHCGQREAGETDQREQPERRQTGRAAAGRLPGGPKLLSTVRHRSAEAQADLNLVRVREALVDGRTALVNAARGLCKAAGERLPPANDQMDVERTAEMPAECCRLRP